jgi:hypothetical protein
VRVHSAKPLPLLLGAASLAVVGALFGSLWATGVGVVVVLGVLALHPTVAGPAVPRSTRRLLRGGLLLLILATVVELSGWVDSPFADTPPSPSELIVLLGDPVRQWTQFLRQLAVATCLILASACIGVAVARLPQERLRRVGRATPTVGPGTLVALLFVLLLPSGLAVLLGSFSNRAVATLLVLGGYAWVLGRALRRHGTATIVVVGGTVLVAVTVIAAHLAWWSRPEPHDDDAVTVIAGSVAVAVETGPDVGGAVAVAALLLGAALTVLGCAGLSPADHERP